MSWTVGLAGVGAAIGSLPGGTTVALGAQLGASLGSLIDAASVKSPKVHSDKRYSGATYGAPISRLWGRGRLDCQVVWAKRNSDGSYLTTVNSGSKKKGGPKTPHSHATYALVIAETGLVFPDGSSVERPIVIDRIRMGDTIVYTSATALVIPAYSAIVTYGFGDYVKSGGFEYTSLADGNVGHSVSSGTWWQKVSTSKNSISFTQHPGPSESTFTQLVDSTIATAEGVANTSAMRGCTYIVVHDQDLFKFGNTIPSNVSIECHTADLTDGDFLSDVCRLCGLKTADFDFSDCTDALSGIAQTNQTAGQDLLTNFLIARGYDLVEIDGKVRAIRRGGAVVRTLSDDDLRATRGKEFPDRLPMVLLADRRELHTSFSVRYLSSDQDFRTVEVLGARNDGLAPNPFTLDLGTMVMTDDEALQMACRLDDTEHLEGGAEYGPIYTTGKHLDLAPGDPIEVNDLFGRPTRYRIVKQTLLPNLLGSWLARDEVEVLDQSHVVGDTEGNNDSSTDLIGPLTFAVASPEKDATDAYASFPGFYVWASTRGGSGVPEGDIWYSFDNFATDPVYGGKIASHSVIGTTITTALADATGAGLDTANTTTLAPTVTNGVMYMSDSTRKSVDAGSQWALLGEEWIGVIDVGSAGTTQRVGGSTKGLLRGLRGSDYTGHVLGEQFAMAGTTKELIKVEVDPAQAGSVVYVQVLAEGQTIGDSPVKTCTITDPTKPFVSNDPPLDPSTVAANSTTYNGANEILSFTASYPTTPPAGQLLYWQYSTNNGSSWSSSTLTGTSYTPPAFSSGTMKVRAMAITTDGRAGAWVTSSNATYAAPTSATPFAETPSGTVNGVNTTFTLSHTPISGTLTLTKNGLTQVPPTNYTLSGTTITFAVAPTGGDVLYAQYSY